MPTTGKGGASATMNRSWGRHISTTIYAKIYYFDLRLLC